MLNGNNKLKQELILKGRKRIKDFSWEQCGKETLDIILNL
jgi:glycosyltransferase involved in cell wall biosynthesis